MKLFYKISLIVLATASQSSLYCQNWAAMGSGTDFYARVFYTDTVDNLLYLGGSFMTIDGDTVRGIAKWDGVKWDSLGAGIDKFNPSFPLPVMSICSYKNDLYVGGGFNQAGDVWADNIAKWNGIQWDSLSNNVNGTVRDMVEYNNLLYLVGSFDTVGTIYSPSIAIWDGIQWSAFPVPPPFSIIDRIIFYNNELYVGGNFEAGQISSIARFDGSQWQPVGNGFVGSLSWINCFEIYQNELYIGGLFFKSNGNVENHLAKWDGTTLSSVGGAGGNSNPQVLDLIVYNNELYAVGVFNTMGGVPADRIAKWDGTQWCGLGTIFDNNILTAVVYNDSLIIGGGFDSINGNPINDIAMWIGGNFVDTCGAVVGIEDKIDETSVFSIYPNPTYNSITIKLDDVMLGKDVSIKIYDIIGQLSYSNIFKKQSNNELNINVTHLPKGVYLVMLQIEEKNYSAKFVKQ